jgi:hypothetical protein
MDKSFEPIIMAAYAELCVSWRMAHVANLVQADDLNAKLGSLESVIKAFDLGNSGQRGSDTPRPTKAIERSGSTFRKAASPKGSETILED